MLEVNELAFHAKNIRKTLDNRIVLDVDELNIRSGAITVLVGGSGSGKTTLLNILGGIDEADSGSLVKFWTGRHWHDVASRSGWEYMSEKASYAFQHGYLVPNASVGLNLRLAGRGARRDDLRRSLSDAGLERDFTGRSLLKRRAWSLSGGQQQRVNLARSFVRDPTLIFADEPSSSLDPRLGRQVVEKLRAWTDSAPGRTVILVTHDYQLATVADDIIVLGQNGRLLIGGRVPTACPKQPDEIERLLEPDTGELSATGAPDATTAAAVLPTRRRRRSTIRDAMLLGLHQMLGPGDGSWLGRLSPSRFKRWDSLVLLVMLVTLSLSLLQVYRYSQTYFETELTNPRLRHVVISSNPLFHDETKLTPDAVEAVRSGGDKTFANSVFPRLGWPETLAVVELEGNSEPRLFNLSVLSLDSAEPVADDTPILSVAGTPTGKTMATMFLESDRTPGAIILVLEQQYFDSIAKKVGLSNSELVSRLRLRGKNGLLEFEIGGLFKDAIPDRENVYQAVTSISTYVNWHSEQQPRALLHGEPRLYDRLAIYFDSSSHGDTLKSLSGTNYVFSRDNFEKITRLFNVATTFRQLLGGLIFGVFAVTFALLMLDAWAQLLRVWKSALILFAHGVSPAVFAVSVCTQFVLLSVIASVSSFALFRLVGDAIGVTVNPILEEASPFILLTMCTVICSIFTLAYGKAPQRGNLGADLKSN